MKKILQTLILHLSMAPVLFAQTGPGGVGSSTTNVLWLTANENVFQNSGSTPAINNGPVEKWVDISGNSRIAEQGTVAFKPVYKTNHVNGMPAIHFDGIDDRLLASMPTSNQLSLFVVASYDSLPHPNPGLIQGATAGNAFSSSIKSVGVWVERTTSRIWGRGIQTNGTTVSLARTTPMSANTFHSILTRFDGSTIKQFLNDQQISDTTYNGSLQSWTDFGIGRQGSETWAGDIAEVIVYNYGVNEAQRIIINNYLSAKYGMSLSANDIYNMDDGANGDYDHDVAGIGRINATNAHVFAKGSIVSIGNPLGLNDNEFMLWGHDNAPVSSAGVTDLPTAVSGRLARTWRPSVQGNLGSVDVTFDLTGFSVNANDLVLLMDMNSNGAFNDETIGNGVIGGAVSAGGSSFKFTGVSGLTDGIRFTVGSTNMQTPLAINDLPYSSFKGILFPNPTDKAAVLKGYMPNAQIAVLNALGQKVSASLHRNPPGEVEIRTAELSNGIYYIRVSTGRSVQMHRLIIQR